MGQLMRERGGAPGKMLPAVPWPGTKAGLGPQGLPVASFLCGFCPPPSPLSADGIRQSHGKASLRTEPPLSPEGPNDPPNRE